MSHQFVFYIDRQTGLLIGVYHCVNDFFEGIFKQPNVLWVICLIQGPFFCVLAMSDLYSLGRLSAVDAREYMWATVSLCKSKPLLVTQAESSDFSGDSKNRELGSTSNDICQALGLGDRCMISNDIWSAAT